MLDQIFGTTSVNENISFLTVLITLAVSILLGYIISFTYMKTGRKDLFSQNFAITLVLTPAVVAIIILLIGSNIARAFSLAGAFSIIRYRSAPGDPKDIALVLFTMAAGLACGVGAFSYALLFTFLLCALLFILNYVSYGKIKPDQRTLKITIPEDLNYEGVFDEIMKKYTDSFELVKVKTTNLGSLFELAYVVALKKGISHKVFIDEIRCKNGNLNITLTQINERSE